VREQNVLERVKIERDMRAYREAKVERACTMYCVLCTIKPTLLYRTYILNPLYYTGEEGREGRAGQPHVEGIKPTPSTQQTPIKPSSSI
jgi:hypothetical protein